MIKRPDGKTIAVIAALLFFTVSAAVGLGIVIHGIHVLNGGDRNMERTVETTRAT